MCVCECVCVCVYVCMCAAHHEHNNYAHALLLKKSKPKKQMYNYRHILVIYCKSVETVVYLSTTLNRLDATQGTTFSRLWLKNIQAQ